MNDRAEALVAQIHRRFDVNYRDAQRIARRALTNRLERRPWVPAHLLLAWRLTDRDEKRLREYEDLMKTAA